MTDERIPYHRDTIEPTESAAQYAARVNDGPESLEVMVSGSDEITADDITRVLAGAYMRPVKITLRSGVIAWRAYVHTIWPDCVECGTRDGTVHAVYPLSSIQSIRRA